MFFRGRFTTETQSNTELAQREYSLVAHVMKTIVERYKGRLAREEGWILKRGADLRIALCYPNVYSIGMANLGFQAMYEIFNRIREVSCERAFLPDSVRSSRAGK